MGNLSVVWPMAFCGLAGLAVMCVFGGWGAETLKPWAYAPQHRAQACLCHVWDLLCSLSDTERVSTGRMQPTDTWAAAGRGSLLLATFTITQKNKEKLSLLLAGLSEEKKKLGSQGGQLSADSASPPLCDSLGSLLNQGLAVCLFGW